MSKPSIRESHSTFHFGKIQSKSNSDAPILIGEEGINFNHKKAVLSHSTTSTIHQTEHSTVEKRTLYTIGHSNRSLQDFLELLEENRIELLVDVRRYPGSRRNPQFNLIELEKAIPGIGIGYRHMKSLGGRRGRSDPDKPNDFWRVDSFRAYADYMGTPEGKEAIDELQKLTIKQRVAVMCAEAVPWRCHRRLIADIFTAEGYEVVNITGPSATHNHEPSETLKQLEDGTYIWPADEAESTDKEDDGIEQNQKT